MTIGLKLLYFSGLLTVVGTLGGLLSALVSSPQPKPRVAAPVPAVVLPATPLPQVPNAAANGQPAPVQVAAPAPAPIPKPGKPGELGTILRETWTGLDGNDVGNLTSSADYPSNPNEIDYVRVFETGENSGDSYGEIFRGFIHPPVSGDYTFWIASDDGGELFLSPNESAKDAKRIANVNGYTEFRGWNSQPNQKSAAVKLEGGKRYYIEARHKEGGGGDHLSVGWQLPDGAQERPIPGSRLSPAVAATRKPPTPPSCKLTGAIPTTPGQHKLRANISFGTKTIDMAYLVELPKNYKPSGQPWPLYTFMHGNTHQGTDHAGLLNEGPALELNQRKELRDFMPMITFIPQCPPDTRWDNPHIIRATVALLDEVVKAFNVDKTRVYCTGLSMGGMGTWRMALEAPDRFAAIVTLCSVAVKPEVAASTLKDMPIWIIVGDSDGGFTQGSKQMYEVLKAAGGKVELTVVEKEGHGVWGRYYPNPPIYQWMLKHQRKP